MKIAYVTDLNPHDQNSWSGTAYFMWLAIENQGIEIVHFQPLPVGWASRCDFFVRRAFRYLHGKRFWPSYSRQLSLHQSRQVDRWLKTQEGISAVLCPGGIAMAHLSPGLPLVTWADATHDLYFSTYPEVARACGTTRRQGQELESQVHRRASAVIFSSEWAADSAKQHCGVAPGKVHVVPFGANFDELPGERVLADQNRISSSSPFTVLFVGQDWYRKGGQVVVEAVKIARQEGYDLRLHLIGCLPPDGVVLNDWVTSDGRLDKQTAHGVARLKQAFAGASVLFVPSLAECYGVVYCEAFAYGVPVIANDVGGVSTIVQHGQNGFLAEPGTAPAAYALYLLRLLQSPELHQQMSVSARQAYECHFNWDTAGRRAADIIRSVASPFSAPHEVKDFNKTSTLS